jgi:hypothetical protein
MFRSELYSKLFLAAAAVSLCVVGGCKSTDEASQQAAQPPQQTTQQAKAHPTPAKPAPAAAKPTPAVHKDAAPKAVAASAKSTQPVQLVSMTVPKGTAITATVGEALASDKNHTGDSFAAILSAPIKVDGKTVLPKGAHVTGRIVGVRKHELKLALASVSIHGKSYDLATNSVRRADKDQLKNNAAAAADSDAGSQDKPAAPKPRKDNSTLSAKTQLTFKLAKPVTVPVKG